MPSEPCRHISMVNQIAPAFQYWRYCVWLVAYCARARLGQTPVGEPNARLLAGEFRLARAAPVLV